MSTEIVTQVTERIPRRALDDLLDRYAPYGVSSVADDVQQQSDDGEHDQDGHQHAVSVPADQANETLHRITAQHGGWLQRRRGDEGIG